MWAGRPLGSSRSSSSPARVRRGSRPFGQSGPSIRQGDPPCTLPSCLLVEREESQREPWGKSCGERACLRVRPPVCVSPGVRGRGERLGRCGASPGRRRGGGGCRRGCGCWRRWTLLGVVRCCSVLFGVVRCCLCVVPVCRGFDLAREGLSLLCIPRGGRSVRVQVRVRVRVRVGARMSLYHSKVEGCRSPNGGR